MAGGRELKMLAVVYLFVVYRSFAGKVTVEEEGY
jgi:hypothetical protein